MKTVIDPNLPDIWLQDDEVEGKADCGCRLVTAHDGSGPALWFCPMHRAATALYDAAVKARAQMGDLVRDGEGGNEDKEAYHELHLAIAQAEVGIPAGKKPLKPKRRKPSRKCICAGCGNEHEIEDDGEGDTHEPE